MICFITSYLIYANILQQIRIIAMLCVSSPHGCGGFALQTLNIYLIMLQMNQWENSGSRKSSYHRPREHANPPSTNMNWAESENTASACLDYYVLKNCL